MKRSAISTGDQRFRTLKTTVMAAGLVIALALLSACETVDPYIVQGDPVQRYEGNGYTIRIEFLDQAFLRARYGANGNPFIAPAALGGERLMVFEVELTGSSPVSFDTTSVELQFGSAYRSAHNRFNFGQYWEVQDDTAGTRSPDARRRQRLITQELLPNRVQLAGGGTEQGLLVFRGRFPSYGEARIIMPVSDARGNQRVEFSFEF